MVYMNCITSKLAYDSGLNHLIYGRLIVGGNAMS